MIAPDCAGLDFLDLLSHDTHIYGVVAPLVAEAIELEAVVEPHKRDDVLLEANVRTTPTATPAAAMPAPAMCRNMSATAVMTHLVTSAVVSDMMTGLVTGAVMTDVVPALVMPTAAVLLPVVMPVPMPIMPAVAAAPPEARHPRTIAAYVPAGSLPTALIPAVITTVPDVLHTLDQFQTVSRRADPIGGAIWHRLCAALY